MYLIVLCYAIMRVCVCVCMYVRLLPWLRTCKRELLNIQEVLIFTLKGKKTCLLAYGTCECLKTSEDDKE